MELQELFEAYYECRRNKRSTYNAIKFEMDYESHLVQLFQDIQNRTYRNGKSIAFIVDRPVKREIFAGDFRDRVVHYYVIGKQGPILEKHFIHDSYSCRKGKWTLYGISRVAGFLRSATQNHAVDAHVLKLDISGFFMAISHNILLSQIRGILDAKYPHPDREELYWLCDLIIRNDPTKNCAIKGSRSDWVGLPKSKSLFFTKSGTGLPIGNLTSQIFANLYLHDLDVFIKKALGFRYYGRYVDDFVLVDQDPERLRRAVGQIRDFLGECLDLELHPKKIYLQHYAKGLAFLWAYIMPNAIYVGRKTKTNFFRMIEKINTSMEVNPKLFHDAEKRHKVLSWLNSYLGLMRHHDTFRIRKKLLLSIGASFWNHFYISDKYRVLVQKTR